VYDRTVAGQPLTFAVSGMLWERSLVMIDQETETLWSHILGQGMAGKHQGEFLKNIPSVMVTWKTWSARHPESQVLWMDRTSNDYRREFYRQPRNFVLGIAEGEDAAHWGFDQLLREGVVLDQFDKQPVVVTIHRDSRAPRIYDRRLGQRELTFRADGEEMLDDQTQSRWDVVTGLATEGQLKGQQLTALPGIVSFRKVWLGFHPKSVGGRRR
jgi:hypothetical protein